MSVSISRSDQLEKARRRLTEYLSSLEEEENHHRKNTFAPVRWVSDLVSGSDASKGGFHEEVEGVRNSLYQAGQSLKEKNLNDAALALESAGAHLRNANGCWRRYISKSMDGAERVVTGLRVVRNSAIAFELSTAGGFLLGSGMALGISAALHAGGMTYLAERPLPEEEKPFPLSKPALLKSEEHAVERRSVNQEQLTAFAQEILKEYKKYPKDPGLFLPHFRDYGSFSVESQILAMKENDPDLNDISIREEWSDTVQAIQGLIERNTDPFDRITDNYRELYRRHFPYYTRDGAAMIHFLKGGGGNCVASTEEGLAALGATLSELPDGWTVAVQKFRDHIQPILYNESLGLVWDLMANRTDSVWELEAPLYDAHLMYHAYLKGIGADSPVDGSEDFILVRAQKARNFREVRPAQLGDKGSGNRSLLELPEGDGIFNPKPVPEKAYLESPYEGRELSPDRSHFRARSVKATDDKWMHLSLKVYGFTVEFDPGVGSMPGYVFQTHEEALDFSQLQDPEAKREFLGNQMHRTLLKALNEPEMKDVLAFLRRPDSVKPDRLARLLQSAGFDILLDLLQGAYPVDMLNAPEIMIDLGFPRTIVFGSEGSERKKALTKWSLSKTPALKRIFSQGIAFRSRIVQDPVWFIDLLDRLPVKDRRKAFVFQSSVERVDYDPEEDPPSFKAVARALSDPNLIGIGTPKGNSKTRVEITVIGGSETTKRPLPTPAGTRAQEVGTLQKTEREKIISRPIAEPSHPLSAAGFFDMFFRYYRYWEPTRRWTKDLSDAFLELNRDGSQDRKFLWHYMPIVTQGNILEAGPLVRNPLLDFPGLHTGYWAGDRYYDLSRIPAEFGRILNDMIRRRGGKGLLQVYKGLDKEAGEDYPIAL